MNPIFVDTNAWVALSFRGDRLHEQVMNAHRDLLRSGARYVTTNYVLDETSTILQSRAGRRAALHFAGIMKSTRIARVIHVGEDLEDEARKLFESSPGQKFSFTDCTSYVVMRCRGLQVVLTSDLRFEQMGFTVLPAPP